MGRALICAISKRNVPHRGYIAASVASLNLISLLNYAQQQLLGERFGNISSPLARSDVTTTTLTSPLIKLKTLSGHGV